MKGLSLKEFYAQSMELKAPWNVADLRIDGESRQVRIRVECACGEIWGDPETNARAEIKDWEERTVTASVPWAAPRGRFTLSFEVHVITLLQQCRTVRGAARLARITEDAADGVGRGLQRRQLAPPASWL